MRPPTGRLVVAAPLLLVFIAASVAAADPTPTPSPDTGSHVGASVRPRPSPRPFTNPAAEPEFAEGDGRGVNAPLPPVPEDVAVDTAARPDDPVLRWLPEITAASAATGTPLSLLAGVMRVESGGDPETVSPQGAQGLMQVMPTELGALGIPQTRWRDPATNVLAGATILAQRSGAGWEAAVASYFGIGCDAYGTCTQQYAIVVLGWANAYAALLGDPIAFDVGNVPDVPSAPSTRSAPGQQTEGQAGSADGTQAEDEPATSVNSEESWSDDEPAAPATEPPAETPPAETPAESTAESTEWQDDE